TCSKRTALPDKASAERSGLSFSLVPYLLNTTMICCRKTHGRLVRFPFYLPCARKKYALAGEAHGRLFPPRSAQAAAVGGSQSQPTDRYANDGAWPEGSTANNAPVRFLD